jgi:ubiquinone/menaquinone biosynthesis C-methylase UbiE
LRRARELRALVAESYDRIAERYLEWRAEQHREGTGQWVSILSERLHHGSKVLDLGCGAGVPLTKSLAETFEVTGLDISPRQIELAHLNVPNARFIIGDMVAHDFRPQSFDAVVASYSLFHVPRAEHKTLLRKIATWLRPGGFFLANFGIADVEVDYEEDWLGAPMFWSSFDAETERAHLRHHGFKLLIDRIETVVEHGKPLRWLLVLGRTEAAP